MASRPIKLTEVLKTAGLHPEPIREALDKRYGRKIDGKGIAAVAFEINSRRHEAGGKEITDTKLLLDGIAAKNATLAAELRARM